MSKLRMLGIGLTMAAFQACGGEGGEAAGGQAAGNAAMAGGAGQMTTPDWMSVNESARTVTLDITAGQTDANNHWNYNGYTNGNATITVPQGYTVTINFTNKDPAMAHSIGVSSQTANFPPMFDNPQPVFPGAISRNPTDAARSTQPNASETITFTAGTAGQYSLVCYVPAHALSGMWVKFNVSAEGQAGVTTN